MSDAGTEMDDTISASKDIFRGPEQFRALSARLARGDSEAISDEEVTQALGLGVAAPFRYAREQLAGLHRKTTREPAFCHSADVAMRAADLGYGAHTIRVALLHDVVEDASSSLVGMETMLSDVGDRFGPATSRDVRVLTNRYSIILARAANAAGLPPDLPPTAGSVARVEAAVEALEGQLPEDIRRPYEYEFRQLLDYFLPRLDIAAADALERIERGHELLSEVSLHAYGLFAEQLADDARARADISPSGFHETPLVVKTLDQVDNLRTCEIVNRMALERIVAKAELFLDKTFYLHAHIHENRIDDATFILMYEYLKHQLVEQLVERAKALETLGDSRFRSLVEYLRESIERLRGKYRVSDTPVARLTEVRDQLRKLNATTAG